MTAFLESALGSTRAIRVAVVSDAVHPWHRGGKETRYEQLLRRLPKLGFEVTVFTMRWWEGEPPAGAITHRAISRKVEMYGNGRRSIKQGIIFALSCLKMLFTGKFDVIEADHMPYLQLFPLRLVAWARRVPLVVTWHEVWGPQYWVTYLGPSGKLAALIERWAARLPDHIVAVSSGTANQLIALGVKPDNVSVLWAGVNVDELDAIDPADDAPDIVCVGRLISHKRVDLVLDAVAVLRSRGRDYTLAVTGAGPELENLTDQAKELGIDDLVSFHGELPDLADVWALLKGSRVCAAPSEREGFGLTVAESLAAGTPVIVVDHPSNASRVLVDNDITGSVIEPGNVTALADAIELWMGRNPEHHAQGVTFEERHPHLSWDAMAARYAELLREMVR